MVDANILIAGVNATLGSDSAASDGCPLILPSDAPLSISPFPHRCFHHTLGSMFYGSELLRQSMQLVGDTGTVSRPSWRRYRKSSVRSAQSWNQLKSSLPGFGRSTQRSINWTRIRRRTRLRSKRLWLQTTVWLTRFEHRKAPIQQKPLNFCPAISNLQP